LKKSRAFSAAFQCSPASKENQRVGRGGERTNEAKVGKMTKNKVRRLGKHGKGMCATTGWDGYVNNKMNRDEGCPPKGKRESGFIQNREHPQKKGGKRGCQGEVNEAKELPDRLKFEKRPE